MNPTDLAFSSALDQARLIRTGDISPLELTQVYLDRIAQHNDRLGAYITVAEERAISTAKQQTEQWHQGDRTTLPPFFGVPMPIKDLAPRGRVALYAWLGRPARSHCRVYPRPYPSH